MPVIEVDHLHKRYGETVAVQDVSFTVNDGEIFGILGPNGAGKTTTVECIEGLCVPDRGSIRVLGLDPRRHRAELRQLLGVQLQESLLPASSPSPRRSGCTARSTLRQPTVRRCLRPSA
jgi:ABC-2 type transport system ATP-binding protein